MSKPISQPEALESDPRFPSGKWTGYFLMSLLPGKHWMELHLKFAQGEVRGEGRDWVGEFLIKGRYDISDGKCWWSKRYVGKHDVAYLGYNEGRGIWGEWSIPPTSKGGFHIWPEGMNIGDANALAREAETPAHNPVVTFEDAEAETLEPVGIGLGGRTPDEPDTMPWN